MGGKIFKVVFLFFIFISAGSAFGYNNKITHPLLSETAVAVYNQNNNQKITDQQSAWVIKGSIDEDTDPRYLNHFYNPITGKGLDGYDRIGNLIFKAQGQPAKTWAKAQNSATGDYSESAILKNYQDGNPARAYQGIGHILHLIQDMAVPAHTRNDPHAGGDPYEKWVEQYGTINPNKLSFINIDSLGQTFDLMANYSNNNFFSKDNIKLDKLFNYKTVTEFVDGKNRKYLLSKIENFNCRIVYTKNPDSVVPVFQVDDDFKLNQDYWNMLYPKAVGYSAGVIDYFVKQFENIDQSKKEEAVSLWGKIKNSLAWLKQEVQYAWGDVYMAQRKALAGDYDNLSALVTNTQNDFQNFSDANREIMEQAAGQAGRVLSAFEQAGSAEEIFKSKSAKAEDAPPLDKNLKSAQAAVNSSPAQPQKTIAPVKTGEPQIQIIPESLIKKEGSPSEGGQPQVNQDQPITVQPASPAQTFIFIAGDGTPPETAITSGPNRLTNLDSAVFIFTASESNSTFDCNLNDNGWEICLAPRNFLGLTDFEHIFKVRARDAYNNLDLTPAEYVWVIDTIPPAITILSGPQDIASSTTANFQFASSEGETAYQCKLDANIWEICSASTTAADLIEGGHSLEIKGADLIGNTGSSTIKIWSVDLTAPTSTIAGLDAVYEAAGFTVAWSGIDADATGSTTPASGIENFDVQYKISPADWQDWINATTSTSTIFNLAVASGQTIYFHARARDLAGNLGEWSEPVQTAISDNLANHLVISEVQIGGDIANDEFIELYNPTDADINLSSYSIQYHGPDAHSFDSFEKKNFFSDSIVRAKKYFLITSSEYDGSVTADFTYAGFHLAASGGTIFLANTHDKLTDSTATSTIVIDRLAYGSGSYLFPEGTAYSSAPAAGQSLERKTNATSTAETMAAGGAHSVLGNAYDSDNNSADFVLKDIPEPQNSSSPSEPNSPGSENIITAGNTSFAYSDWRSDFSWKYTITGNNPVLIVAVHADNQDVNSISYNGQSMILAAQKAYNQPYYNIAISIYYLTHPSAGENNLEIRFNRQIGAAVSAITFNNCDTADPIGLVGTFFSTSTSMTNSVTTDKANVMLVDAVTYNMIEASTLTPNQGQTGYFIQPQNSKWYSVTNQLYAGESYKLAEQAGLQTMGWTASAGYPPVHVILGLNPNP